MNKPKKSISGFVFVFLIAVVPFLPSAFYGTTNWDDPLYVLDNPLLKRDSPEIWKKIFFETYANFYHPFTLISLKVDRYLFGPGVEGHHWVNILLHGLNSLLLLNLLRRWVRKDRLAFLITLFFALHPLRTEVVCWLSERKEVLCTTFSLLALNAYRPCVPGRPFPTSSFLFFLCALLSKSMAVSLPLIFLLVDLFQTPRGLSRRGIFEKIPFFLASLLFVFLSYRAQFLGGTTVSVQEQRWGENLLFMAYSSGFYILKTIIPFGMSALYSLDKYTPEAGDWLPCVLFPLSLLVAGIFFLRTKDRRVLFGLLFYFIALLPVSGLVRFGPVLVADRFAYFPSIGLGLSLGWIIFLGVRGRVLLCRAAYFLAVLVLVGLGFLATLQSKSWKDPFHLWTAVLEKEPTCVQGWTNLCSAYLLKGDVHEADRFCSKALEMDPRDFRALLNRGIGALLRGRLDSASRDFAKAEAIAPDDISVLYSKGLLAVQQERNDAAISCFEQVLHRNPFHREAAGMVGMIYHGQGKDSKALPFLEMSVRGECRDEAVYRTLLQIYLSRNRITEGLSLCRKWLPMARKKEEVYQKICLLRLWNGQEKDARECFERFMDASRNRGP